MLGRVQIHSGPGATARSQANGSPHEKAMRNEVGRAAVGEMRAEL